MSVNTKLYHMAEAKDMLPVSRSVSVIAVLFVLVF